MRKKIALLSKWNKNDLICACLQLNPCCSDCKNCEELEVHFNTYDDIEECLRNQRAYTRAKGGALKQR